MARPPWLPIALALALLPAEALGMGVPVGKDGEQVGLAAVRIAVATTASRTTRWAQVSVSGASAGFAWLVPVRPGARLDLASDAWLDALDAASAPVVLPPSAAHCASTAQGPDRIAPGASPATTRPSHAAILFDVASVEAFVAGAGYAVPPGLAGPLATVFANGEALAALVYDSATLPVRTLRIVDDGPADFPLSLSGSTLGDVAVTAFVVGGGSENVGNSPLRLDPSTILWGEDGRSSYAQARASAVAGWQGTRWLTESATSGLLFDGVRADAATTYPAVLDRYFSLAASYGDATGDPVACAAAARGTRTDSTGYVAACPSGALAVVPGALPCAPPADDGTPIDALFCGGTADDAVLAVAGLAPPSIWVTRAYGLVTAESASDVSVTPAGSSAADAVSAVLTAGGYASACPAPPTSSGSTQPAPVSTAPSSSDPSSGSSDAAAAAAADGCAVLGSACSGDSSSSSGDGSSGCSGDSGGSGDSSGGCSSSSGGSSGDGSSGGCSNSGGSSSSSCALARPLRAPRRSPVSRIVLLLAAVAFVARRRGRRRD